MQTLNSSSLSFLSISSFIFIFIIVSSPTSFSEEDVYLSLFRNCSSHFSCGKSFPNIRYPFWGGNKSPDCGLDGFHLTCQQGDILTIDIAGQIFRVLSISTTSYALRIARNDLWDDICPENYENRAFDASPFHPGHEVRNITLFYACPADLSAARIPFSCKNVSDNSVRNVFYANDNSVRNVFYANDPGCESNITFLALESEVEEFSGNPSVDLLELLHQGFDVEYNLNRSACFPCELSGGLCWSGTNSTEHGCLCSDGVQDNRCLTADRGINVKKRIRIGVIGAGSVGCALVIIIFICCLYHNSLSELILRKKRKERLKLEAFIRQYESLAPKRYTYSEIKKMTKSFKGELGQGGYGTVYKGKLSDGRLVAVKILKVAKGDGEEFVNEVLSIGRTSHVNVVTLLGFCLEGEKRALVYEYMPNGSLEKYIHVKKNSMSCNQLGMAELCQISLGIARGLEYLHRGCNTRILHFDIKPHNILLDENFCPKISDFGLARQCTKDESIVSILGARGTIGYIAPELVCRSFGGVSYKSDVYSYGMLIIEIVGGRKNVSLETSHTSEVYFPYWAYQHLVVEGDLRLKGVVTPEEDEIGKKILLVGLWCIQNDPSQRPTMSKVIEMLEGNSQAIAIPPKAFFGFPSTTPQPSSITSIVVSE